MDINAIAERVNSFTNKKGWWKDKPESRIPRLVVWLKEEADEILEAWETHQEKAYFKFDDEGIVKPEGLPHELADLIMIALDIAAEFDIDIDTAIDKKFLYNTIRKYKRDYKGEQN